LVIDNGLLPSSRRLLNRVISSGRIPGKRQGDISYEVVSTWRTVWKVCLIDESAKI
jgi:hypothetical protein